MEESRAEQGRCLGGVVSSKPGVALGGWQLSLHRHFLVYHCDTTEKAFCPIQALDPSSEERVPLHCINMPLHTMVKCMHQSCSLKAESHAGHPSLPGASFEESQATSIPGDSAQQCLDTLLRVHVAGDLTGKGCHRLRQERAQRSILHVYKHLHICMQLCRAQPPHAFIDGLAAVAL